MFTSMATRARYYEAAAGRAQLYCTSGLGVGFVRPNNGLTFPFFSFLSLSFSLGSSFLNNKCRKGILLTENW